MPQIGRSDHFVAKSLLHLESKVDNSKVKMAIQFSLVLTVFAQG